jgi:hypothetical protein
MCFAAVRGARSSFVSAAVCPLRRRGYQQDSPHIDEAGRFSSGHYIIYDSACPAIVLPASFPRAGIRGGQPAFRGSLRGREEHPFGPGEGQGSTGWRRRTPAPSPCRSETPAAIKWSYSAPGRSYSYAPSDSSVGGVRGSIPSIAPASEGSSSAVSSRSHRPSIVFSMGECLSM